MQDKLGQVFAGRISAVTGFGIFVELDDVYAEGLVHITSQNIHNFYTQYCRHIEYKIKRIDHKKQIIGNR